MFACPQFSVVLPTKDRPKLAAKAICSVLAQTHEDFEIIIGDNGDKPLDLDVGWSSDPRVRVHRTGGLIMCDNWQSAFDQARGTYVLMIEDKMTLVPNCLQVMLDLFSRERLDILTFAIGTKHTSASTRESISNPRVYPLDREELLDAVAECRLDHYSKIAPRTLNSVFRRAYAEKVSNRVGRLFRPMSPDYSCGALLLGGGGKFGYVPTPLCFFMPGPSLGNAYVAGGSVAKIAEKEFGGSIHDLVAKLPSKSLLFGNTLLGELLDFLEAGGISRQRLVPREIPYWLMLIAEALVCIRTGSDRNEEVAECFREIRSKSFGFRMALTVYLFRRFVKGWPNRKLRMRENLPDAVKVLGHLLKFP